MMRWALTAMLVCVLGGIGPSAAAQATGGGSAGSDAIASMLGELRWNMGKSDLFEVMAGRIKARYKPRIAEAGGIIEEDRLYQQMRGEIRRLREHFFVFEGEITGWDVSLVAPEFRHGSAEAMLVVNEDRARNFYFFIKNRFWKWYRAFEPGTFGGRSFEEIVRALEGRFGPGDWHEREPEEEGPDARWVAWEFARTRVRAVRRGQGLGLVLESKQILRQLAHLRRNALPRRKHDTSTIDSVLAEAHDGERPVVGTDQYANAADEVIDTLRSKSKRSEGD